MIINSELWRGDSVHGVVFSPTNFNINCCTSEYSKYIGHRTWVWPIILSSETLSWIWYLHSSTDNWIKIIVIIIIHTNTQSYMYNTGYVHKYTYTHAHTQTYQHPHTLTLTFIIQNINLYC